MLSFKNKITTKIIYSDFTLEHKEDIHQLAVEAQHKNEQFTYSIKKDNGCLSIFMINVDDVLAGNIDYCAWLHCCLIGEPHHLDRHYLISDLVVREGYRGGGIGTFLINALKFICAEDNLKLVVVDLPFDNEELYSKTVPFYRQQGFIICGTTAEWESSSISREV